MANKIKLWGILANGFLLTALIMSFFDLPNQALLIIGGILIMIFIVVPVFLVFSNRQSSANKKINWGLALSSFLFIPILFFILQDVLLSFKTAIIILSVTGSYILWYIINAFRQGGLIWNKVSFFHYWLMFIILIFSCTPIELQLADNSYNPIIENPAYPKGEGSLIYIDGGHRNFHTLDTRLFSTGRLLEQDGYRVQSFNEIVSLEKLEECDIFLIVNALNQNNVKNWVRPIYSAFSSDEVNDIKNWVYSGGALFLIADHMPFPGAIDNLATQFGFEYEDGFARDTVGNADYFDRKSKSLINNTITNGRDSNESVDSILTFSGSAIKLPADATPILQFDSTWVSYKPDAAWEFEGVKPSSVNGYSQGAYKTFGKGRVIVFGEAMMFTAQLGGGLSWIKIGMNSESSPDNYQLFLNSIHWLDGLID